MTPLERLLAEELPTGTFGHAEPPTEPEPPPKPIEPWTTEEQAQHYADLLTGIDGWHYREPEPETEADVPHLRLVDDTEHTDTTAA
ncbi:hypothetical protein ACFXKC_28435 [Streptomyces sp. NPDC059340]|uniref:hypothetical protein n=1 Tax=Streptomyces sp. NPDC059340 TaxID=3346806 RepID=UPI003684C37B